MFNQESILSLLESRYASREMVDLFSNQKRYSMWRRLWTELAKGQKNLGCAISAEQIFAMEDHINDIDFARVDAIEKETKHDVMAHIQAYGEKCPIAKGIIHLGCTSSFVTDNGDLLIYRDALQLIKSRLVEVNREFSSLAMKYADVPTVGWTHYQAAQPTTVGKRFCLWLQDLMMDLESLEHLFSTFRFLGVKGATGTASAILDLFEGDSSKVASLEKWVAEQFNFNQVIPISGQTYTRKQDSNILSVLKGIASSLHKFGMDLRLLAHEKEMYEGKGKYQVGSSAMPQKQNPIYAERMCSLAKVLASLEENGFTTHATQWLERSLDDSASRKIVMPLAFLLGDSILCLAYKILKDLKVDIDRIEKNLLKQLPFLSLEGIMTEMVKKGKDRGAVHEVLRKHACEADDNPDKLIEGLLQDPYLGLTRLSIQKWLDPFECSGLAIEQTKQYIQQDVSPILKRYHLEHTISRIER